MKILLVMPQDGFLLGAAGSSITHLSSFTWSILAWGCWFGILAATCPRHCYWQCCVCAVAAVACDHL
jgi:hypothetical protein